MELVTFTANNAKLVSVQDMSRYLHMKRMFSIWLTGGELPEQGRVALAKLAIEDIPSYRALRNAMPEWTVFFIQIEREVLATVEALSN